ncbi:MAG TPA: IS110 family transposase [Ramlibacter sp.]|nr:IS110 family transposase [Ramlibacter sp.]
MREITQVGVDLAKQVIQVHAADAAGQPVSRRAIARRSFLDWCAKLPAGCVIVMEACTGAHHWARQLAQLGLTVRLIAPHLAGPFRRQGRSGKNDANDAAAIWEASLRQGMHFVPIKTVEQQAVLAVHTARSGMQVERTAMINRLRAMLAEFGIALPIGPHKLRTELPGVLEDASNELPGLIRHLALEHMEQWRVLDDFIARCDLHIKQHARKEPRAQQAQQVPGVGPLGASALVATVGDMRQFKNGRQFACWLGLTPSQNSSGGKARLGSITKKGDRYLRMLLVQGAKSVIHLGKRSDNRLWVWLQPLIERVGWQKAAVALAAKNARALWAMLTRGTAYQPDHISVKPEPA